MLVTPAKVPTPAGVLSQTSQTRQLLPNLEKSRHMVMGNTWTHHTSAQLVARSLVHREAEGLSHTVGDVSAL